MKLYEIANDYSSLSDLDDPDMPEDAILDTLEGLKGELQEKAVNVAAFFGNLDADVKAMKEAESRIAKRRKAIEKKTAFLKEYLKSNMEKSGITEITCPYFVIKVKKNPGAVIIDDINMVPRDYIKVRVEEIPDKTAIKEALKAGDVPGARIEHGTRLEIK